MNHLWIGILQEDAGSVDIEMCVHWDLASRHFLLLFWLLQALSHYSSAMFHSLAIRLPDGLLRFLQR